MAAHPDLSIIIPAYNESRRILPTLEALGEYLANSGQSVETIVVCDGCTDDTEAVVCAFPLSGLRVIFYEKNRGKGYAVRTGVLASHGRQVIFADADGATPFAEIPRLATFLAEGYDIAIGSRKARGAKVVGHQPWRRRVLGRLFASATRLALGLPFRDTQCGFKMLQGEVARRLFHMLECPGFGFDLELLVMARSRGLRTAEVGVEWHDQSHSTVSPLRDGLRMLGTLRSLRKQSRGRSAPLATEVPATTR